MQRQRENGLWGGGARDWGGNRDIRGIGQSVSLEIQVQQRLASRVHNNIVVAAMSINPIILVILHGTQMEEISRKLVMAFKDINDMCRTALMVENARIASINFVERAQPPIQINGSKEIKEPPKEVPEHKPPQRIPVEEIVIDDVKEKKAPKRTKKIAKDPELPKKPLGSYIMFQRDRKQQILDKNPSISLTELAKLLGKEWQKLEENVKTSYINKFKVAKRKYEKEMEEYRKKHPDYEEPKRKKKAVVEKSVSESSEQIEVISDDPIRLNNHNKDVEEDSLGQDL